MFKCDECDDWTTKYKHCLTRHIENVHSKLFKCNYCRQKFKTKDDQLLHEKTKHPNLHCTICNSKNEHVPDQIAEVCYHCSHNIKNQNDPI